jgi:hypothetical protein
MFTATRLVAREPVYDGAPGLIVRIGLEIDISERLAGGILDDEALLVLVNKPWGREAAGHCMGGSLCSWANNHDP